ncbi:MAG TPA: hypothetical protein VGC76_12015 [Pyrinomonadaceae bacterium]|jgi:hypothetical protein
MKASKFFILTVVVISAAIFANAQVQTIFNLEENVSKKASIPDAVIAVLKSDKAVDACFQEKGKGAVNEADWFEASKIDLNADRRPDLIIKAKDSCLFGANQGPFWIFQNAPDGYQQIFSASGLQLAVLPKKQNSFNQIKISKAVAMKPSSRIFSFKNGKYQ